MDNLGTVYTQLKKLKTLGKDDDQYKKIKPSLNQPLSRIKNDINKNNNHGYRPKDIKELVDALCKFHDDKDIIVEAYELAETYEEKTEGDDFFESDNILFNYLPIESVTLHRIKRAVKEGDYYNSNYDDFLRLLKKYWHHNYEHNNKSHIFETLKSIHDHFKAKQEQLQYFEERLTLLINEVTKFAKNHESINGQEINKISRIQKKMKKTFGLDADTVMQDKQIKDAVKRFRKKRKIFAVLTSVGIYFVIVFLTMSIEIEDTSDLHYDDPVTMFSAETTIRSPLFPLDIPYTINGENISDLSTDAVGEFKSDMKVLWLDGEARYTVLPAPMQKPSCTIDKGTLELSTDTEDASGYEVVINEREHKTDEQTFNLSDHLVEGENHLKIKALASDSKFEDSGYTERKVYKLPSPEEIAIENTKLNWKTYERADGYEITIDDKTYTTSDSEWDLPELEAGEYDLKLRAMNKSDNDVFASDYSESITIIRPENDLNLRYQDEAIVWDDVSDTYSVTLNDEAIEVSDQRIPEDRFEEGKNTLKVIAEYSDERTMNANPFETTITKIPEPSMETEGSNISWDTYEDGLSYELWVNGEKETIDSNTFDASDLEAGTHTLELNISHPDDPHFIPFHGEEETFNKLSSIDDLFLNDEGTLSWDEVENAEEYDVYIDDDKVDTVSGQTYSLNMDSGDEATIEIVAVSPSSTSADPVSYTVSKLNQPKDLDYSNDTLSWETVDNADSYEVTIGETTEKVTDTEIEWETDEVETAEIQALNEDDQVLPSDMLEFSFGSLDKPEVSHDVDALDRSIMIEWTNTYDIKNYTGELSYFDEDDALIDTIPIDQSDKELTIEEPDVRSVSFDLETDQENPLLLDATSDYTFTVDKLETPDNLNYDNGIINWTENENADYYRIDIDGSIHTSSDNTLEYDLDSSVETVRVQSVKNGSFASNWSENLEIQHADSVENVRIEGKNLVWDELEDAASYDVTMNDEEAETVNDASFPVESSGEHIVEIEPNGEEGTSLVSEPVEFSFTKLSSPQDISITEVANNPGTYRITWDNVSEADYYDIKLIREPTDGSGEKEQDFEESSTEIYVDGSSYDSIEIHITANNDSETFMISDEASKVRVINE